MTITQIKFCSEQCFHQKSGELSVYSMCFAFEYALQQKAVTVEFIRVLGEFVEPRKNGNGFRNIPVYFINYSLGLDPSNIPRAIESLVESWDSLSATDIYYEFEEIHPFIDGNGRVGAILYNMKLDRLYSPISPPFMFTYLGRL